MKIKQDSYNLGNLPPTNLKEILRRIHHQVAHRKYSNIDFVSFCEDICKIAERYISAEKAAKDKIYTLERITQQKQILEETLFQILVKKSKSLNSLEPPIDIVYLEDIQEGRVLIYDGVRSSTRNSTEQSNKEKRKILISHKKVEFSEYYPVGYNLRLPTEIPIGNIFKSLKARAKVKSRGRLVHEK